jgi:hypothetical protein
VDDAGVLTRDRAWLTRRRLATQRLAGGALPHPSDVVRLLTAVQAQDAPMAAWSLGQRSRGATYAAVLADQARGGFVRTHVLRPTWHFVAAEDLRWLLRLTSPKVESGMAARHRQLELDDVTLGRSLEAIATLLGDGRTLTRAEIGTALAERRLPGPGVRLGHVLLVAELRAVVCSGPPRGTEHTYALLDTAVPAGPSDALTGEEAIATLVRRFVGGHGPASERDLARWCTLTLTQIRAALAELGDAVASVDVEGHRLWFDPAVAARTTREHAAYLLPVFDEAFLTYADLGLPRSDPDGVRIGLWARIGGGIVVVDGRDVGMFARRLTGDGVTVSLRPDHRWTRAEQGAVAEAAGRLGAFLEREVTLSRE